MAIYNPDAPRRLPLSRREKLIRAVGAIVLLGTTAWLLANWGSLPVRLPVPLWLWRRDRRLVGARFPGTAPGHRLGRVLLLAVTRYFPRGWSFSGLPVTDRTPSHALLPDGRDAHGTAAGHCPDLCLPQCLASHLPALARVVVACVPGQPVRKPGLVSLAGSPAGTHPAQGVKPLHGNAVL